MSEVCWLVLCWCGRELPFSIQDTLMVLELCLRPPHHVIINSWPWEFPRLKEFWPANHSRTLFNFFLYEKNKITMKSKQNDHEYMTSEGRKGQRRILTLIFHLILFECEAFIQWRAEDLKGTRFPILHSPFSIPLQGIERNSGQWHCGGCFFFPSSFVDDVISDNYFWQPRKSLLQDKQFTITIHYITPVLLYSPVIWMQETVSSIEWEKDFSSV